MLAFLDGSIDSLWDGCQKGGVLDGPEISLAESIFVACMDPEYGAIWVLFSMPICILNGNLGFSGRNW
jgi:hypothetical protein